MIVALAGCPWIVGIAYYWRKQVKDGSVPQSLGEQLRQRMTFR